MANRDIASVKENAIQIEIHFNEGNQFEKELIREKREGYAKGEFRLGIVKSGSH